MIIDDLAYWPFAVNSRQKSGLESIEFHAMRVTFDDRGRHRWLRVGLEVLSAAYRHRPAQARHIIEPGLTGEIERIVGFGSIDVADQEELSGHRLTNQLDQLPLLGEGTCLDQPSQRILWLRDVERDRVVEIIQPSLELQLVFADKLQDFRNGIRPLPRMQVGINQTRVEAPVGVDVGVEVVPTGNHVSERMFEHLDPGRVLLHAEHAECLLQHLDADAGVIAVEHEAHHPMRLEDLAQSTQAGARIGQVMKDARGDDEIERALEGRCLFQVQVVEREVVEIMLLLEELLMRQ